MIISSSGFRYQGTVNKDKSIAATGLKHESGFCSWKLRVVPAANSLHKSSMEINLNILPEARRHHRKGQWDLYVNTPYCAMERLGILRMDTATNERYMFNTDSTKQRFVNATMILAEKGDQLAGIAMGRACEYECMDQHRI